MAKVIIAGGRTFNNYQIVENTMNELTIEIEEIVCGSARGADTLGEQWAKNHNIPIKYFIPEWEVYGKYAGIKRNHDMGDYADYLVAFWDGESRGTKDMINYMKRKNKHGKVIMYDQKRNDD